MWKVEGNINAVWKRIATCVKNILYSKKSGMPETRISGGRMRRFRE